MWRCCKKFLRGQEKRPSTQERDEPEEGNVSSTDSPKFSRAFSSNCVAGITYPMTCVRMDTFLELDILQPFDHIAQQKLHVIASSSSVVHLISHQWLGNRHADPNSVQLRKMQQVFRTLMKGHGQSLFQGDDWSSFLHGVSTGSNVSVREAEANASHSKRKTEDALIDDVALGLVWIDFLSIPQLTNRVDSLDVDACNLQTVQSMARIDTSERRQDLEANLAAVNSIPGYVEMCQYFWVLAPRAAHADSLEICDFNTWRSRGWCRLEEWTNSLSRRRKMPLVITDSPYVRTIGNIDFLLSQLGRPEKAPCNGDFSCCRMNHEVGGHRIPCDKLAVSDVLFRMYESKLLDLEASSPRLMRCLLLCLEKSALAGTTGARAISREITSFSSLLSTIMYQDLSDVNEIGDTPLHWATFFAGTDIIKRIVSADNSLVYVKSKAGFSAATMSVYRSDNAFADIFDAGLGFEALSEINHVTKMGIGMLDRAAKSGFADKVRVLIKYRAKVDELRIDNGRTPLLSAAEAGYADCCRELLANGADVRAVGHDGCNALHLAADPVTLTGNCFRGAKLDVAKVLLQYGADPLLCNHASKSAVDVAREYHQDEMVNILLASEDSSSECSM
eukprot:TRINITY_DN643_c0_g2_i1.p1 TRINITY_DN643_c0_g2~~TRINITY_DN643_c0_g2_i1.p1  ORF type:complete len:618 (-),score=72.33 TRINITY_DN643_c0_g2_i1:197-2050(-)